MSKIRMLKQGFLFLLTALLFLFPLHTSAKSIPFDQHKYIYDYAGLLTDKEVAKLQALSSKLGKERDTAFMIITVNGTDGKELKQYVEDFYDENAPGYDQPNGNTAILALDMKERDVYLTGFGEAETYLDAGRLDSIREDITPDISDGNYFQAFSDYITTSHEYMGEEPSSSSQENNGTDSSSGYNDYGSDETNDNQENILFQWWFQLFASLILGGIVVGVMAYRSSGRVTVNGKTYINSSHSKVINKYDTFVRQTVTKVRKPQNNNNNHSNSGGGISGGGHSHSGSGGKF